MFSQREKSQHMWNIHLKLLNAAYKVKYIDIIYSFYFYSIKYDEVMDWEWGPDTCCMRCMHLDDCTPYALLTMWGMSYLAHIAASSSSLENHNTNTENVYYFTMNFGAIFKSNYLKRCHSQSLQMSQKILLNESSGLELKFLLPVRDPRSKTGCCWMNTQDVLRPELLNLSLNCFKVRSQFIPLENILHNYRFKT